MDFKRELDIVLGLGARACIGWLQSKQAQDPNFINKAHWLENGTHTTLLHYLIASFPDTVAILNNESFIQNEVIPIFSYLLQNMQDCNIDEPLHAAIAAGKFKLAFILLDLEEEYLKAGYARSLFCPDRRNKTGQTLLSLAISSKNEYLLHKILLKKPQVEATSLVHNISYLPIHQAVVLNFSSAISLLAQSGAQLTIPFGKDKETAVHVAVRLKKLQVLDALLEQPAVQLHLEDTNRRIVNDKVYHRTAVEEVCEQLREKNNLAFNLQALAMLLCNGAAPPQSLVLQNTLIKYRLELLQAISNYLETKPQLVNAFVARCHLGSSTLHHIFYSQQTWSSAFARLLGKPNPAALYIENLIVRKYQKSSGKAALANTLSPETDSIKYALFVTKYKNAYESKLFVNPWSKMRLLIAEGKSDWKTVEQYAKSHPKSRTAEVVKTMLPLLEQIGQGERSVHTNPTACVRV